METSDEAKVAIETQITMREAQNRRLELLRLAKEVLVENARSKPVDQREVTSEDITQYATNLSNYVVKG